MRSIKRMLIGALVCLMCAIVWIRVSARKSHSVAYVFDLLQEAEASGQAKDELINLAKTNPDTRKYLGSHLPQVIADEKLLHSNNSVWINAVCLAGDLQVTEAAPSLAHWIGLTWGGVTGMPSYAALEDNPPGQALAMLGDRAVPVLKDVLDHDSVTERTNAVRSLFLIRSDEARSALTMHLKDESDPQLRKTIEGIVRMKQHHVDASCSG